MPYVDLVFFSIHLGTGVAGLIKCSQFGAPATDAAASDITASFSFVFSMLEDTMNPRTHRSHAAVAVMQ